jgi:predicted CxxxxCH...CXXCH cytochrome family protein
VWNGASCSNSYCHGDAGTGGAHTSPVWTTVDGTQSQCSSCHGLPPPPPHPDNAACEQCHGAVVGAGNTIVNPAQHIDGVLQVDSVHPVGWAAAVEHGMSFNAQGPASCATAACHGTALNGGASNVSCDSCHSGWKTTCTFCHGGGDNVTGAPPATIDGTVGRTNPLVGAHTEHVETTTMHGPWNCSYCHTQPSSALSPAHVDGDLVSEVVFSPLNPAATYNQGTGTCSNLYCHGNGRVDDGSDTWVNNPTYDCRSCHDDSNGGQNLSGRHRKHIADEKMECHECHQDVLDAGQNIIDVLLHVNGVKDVSMVAGGNWDPAQQRCSGLPDGACHGTESW